MKAVVFPGVGDIRVDDVPEPETLPQAQGPDHGQLRQYRSKRDLGRSREPAGEVRTASGVQPRFVIHKHDARQLHFDLRLEQDGVLKSWALPKGPSLKPGEKRLAVQVEDHPLEYGEFEGVIPKDAYGGGTVMLWDRGHWTPIEKGKRNVARIDFVLDGERLRGAWTLARMSGKADPGSRGNNWLLIKRRDTERGRTSAPTSRDSSVLSGRTMNRIAKDRDNEWDGAGDGRRAKLPDAASLPGARKAALPKQPRPLLPSLVDSAPAGDDWLHEIKLDGYRLLTRIDEGRVQLLTRSGQDWAGRFPRLTETLNRLPVAHALLDGEAVALGGDGISSFERLQEALSAGRTDDIIYQVFDLLYLGQDLTLVPLSQRKHALEQLLASAGLGDDAAVRYSDHQQGRGQAFYQQACRMGLEGIVCKRAGSTYHSGRSKQWLKVKCSHDDEFVVGGFTNPGGVRQGFGALLLGGYDADGRFRYSGRVGTGFSAWQLESLHCALRRLQQDRSPFHDHVPDAGKVRWVRPRMVVDVTFTQRTRDGRLRHPSFRGVREDRNADEIRLPPARRAAKPERRRQRSGSTRTSVAGVRLTHPQRVVYPELGLTKVELARWYESIQDWILPGLAHRPVSLLRCLECWNGECFFQKHPGEAIPDGVPRIAIAGKAGTRDYIYVRSVSDLVALVQAGTLEFHPWGSRVDELERPDRIVFDLDPAPRVPWSELLRVARGLRERLEALGLASFVRATGGKGLHLVVPLTRGPGWDQVKTFAHAVAHEYARDEPRRLTSNMSKDKRRGRIFIDYLRNARGATAIASYSVRARQRAPVAVPLRWDELGPKLRSDRYSVDNLQRRLSTLRDDPWAGFDAARQPLTRRMRRQVGIEGD